MTEQDWLLGLKYICLVMPCPKVANKTAVKVKAPISGPVKLVAASTGLMRPVHLGKAIRKAFNHIIGAFSPGELATDPICCIAKTLVDILVGMAGSQK